MCVLFYVCSDSLAQSALLAYKARCVARIGGASDSCQALCDRAAEHLQKSMDLPCGELNSHIVQVSSVSYCVFT